MKILFGTETYYPSVKRAPSQWVYHQDLTTNANQPHLKIDKLGAGDFIFVDSVPAGQNLAHSCEQKGLLTPVERSPTATGNTGHLAVVNGEYRNAGFRTSHLRREPMRQLCR